jgi:hypothetical protein
MNLRLLRNAYRQHNKICYCEAHIIRIISHFKHHVLKCTLLAHPSTLPSSIPVTFFQSSASCPLRSSFVTVNLFPYASYQEVYCKRQCLVYIPNQAFQPKEPRLSSFPLPSKPLYQHTICIVIYSKTPLLGKYPELVRISCPPGFAKSLKDAVTRNCIPLIYHSPHQAANLIYLPRIHRPLQNTITTAGTLKQHTMFFSSTLSTTSTALSILPAQHRLS